MIKRLGEKNQKLENVELNYRYKIVENIMCFGNESYCNEIDVFCCDSLTLNDVRVVLEEEIARVPIDERRHTCKGHRCKSKEGIRYWLH